ncbi:MAG: DUF4399 domain-containing protein [Acidimicrobiales bacterium]
MGRLATQPAVIATIALAILAAGCSAAVEQTIDSGEEVSLSDALAFREGDPRITIVQPSPDAMVTSPVLIEVDTSNLMLSPSGETHDGQGHLHVFIDQDCLQPGTVIPTDSTTIHVGDGTGGELIDLSPGHHDLCLQIGDGFHIAVAIVQRISVFVFEPMTWPGESTSVDGATDSDPGPGAGG